MKKVVYYQPEAKDPVLNDSVILDIVKKYDNTVTKVDFVDETGGEARTYSVDDKIILKVQRPHRLRNKTSQEKEMFYLKQLEPYKDISVPVIYGYGKVDNIEYTCMSKIPGKAVRYIELTLKQRENILYDLGVTLYKIHNIDKQPFITSKLFPNDDNVEGVKGRLEYEFDWKLKRIEDISIEEKENAIDLKNQLLSKIKELDEFVPIHTNPASTHTFVNGNFEFSGLIDFGDAIISHPVLDIKRWNIDDRKLLLKGYFSTVKPSSSFQNVIDITIAIDSITEILKENKSLLAIKNVDELIKK